MITPQQHRQKLKLIVGHARYALAEYDKAVTDEDLKRQRLFFRLANRMVDIARDHLKSKP